MTPGRPTRKPELEPEMSLRPPRRWSGRAECVAAHVAVVALGLLAAACTTTSDPAAENPDPPGDAAAQRDLLALDADEPRLAPSPPEPPVAPTSGGPGPAGAPAGSGGEFVSLHADWATVCGLRGDGRVECFGGGREAWRELEGGRFRALSFGRFFGCGVRVGGRLVCWGEAPSALVTSPRGKFIDVAVAEDHVCAVRAGGALACWGNDRRESWSTAAAWDGLELPGGEFTAVSAGWLHVCGLRADGEVVCREVIGETWSLAGRYAAIFSAWDPYGGTVCGLSIFGGVTCGNRDDGIRAVGVAGKFVSVSLGGEYGCGVRVDGSLACWGQRHPGQCDNGLRSECWGWDAYPAFAPVGPFTAVGVALSLIDGLPAPICAVRAGGDIVCWNTGAEAQAPPGGEFTALDASRRLACGLRPGGRATCWGLVAVPPGVVEPRWEGAAGRFVSLSVGAAHACGLRAGGEAACWGADVDGETDAPPGRFSAVSAGHHLSCGLRPGGDVECWGANQWWQAAPPPGPFSAVYAGDERACGLRPGGRAECWGRDRGAGEADPSGEFVSLHLAAGCGLRPGGELACWGAEEPGALPEGPFTSLTGSRRGGCALRRNGGAACWGNLADGAPPGKFRTLAAAGSYLCGIGADGALRCPALDLRLPVASPEPHHPDSDRIAVEVDVWDLTGSRAERLRALEPAGVAEALQWVQRPLPAGPFAGLAAGGLCGIRPGGRLDCWGAADARLQRGRGVDRCPDGRLNCWGDADSSRERDNVYEAFSVGVGDWCGIGPDGRLDCRGGDPSDAAANDHEYWSDDHPAPAGTFSAVTVGIERACAVRTSGEIACWGPRAGADENRPPAGLYTAVSIGDSHRHTYAFKIDYSQHACALTTGGDAVCWGDNAGGQTRVPPERLAAAPYLDIAAGGEHTCALRATGEILCWGDNTYGQTEAPDGTYTAITAGRWHTCALTAAGDASCWGDGVAAYSHHYPDYIDPPPGTPNTAPPPGPFTAISAGPYHTCALRTDGEVACWYSY